MATSDRSRHNPVKPSEEYSPEEAARRARQAIKRSFTMPYTPQKDSSAKRLARVDASKNQLKALQNLHDATDAPRLTSAAETLNENFEAFAKG